MVAKPRLHGKGGHCCICGMLTIHGLSIMDRWICPQCERGLVGIDATASDYGIAMSRMKELWDGQAAPKGRRVWHRP